MWDAEKVMLISVALITENIMLWIERRSVYYCGPMGCVNRGDIRLKAIIKKGQNICKIFNGSKILTINIYKEIE